MSKNLYDSNDIFKEDNIENHEQMQTPHEKFVKQFDEASKRIAENHAQIEAAVNKVFNDESSAADMSVRDIVMQAIMNAPSISMSDLEKQFPVLQVHVFEYIYWDGPTTDKRTEASENLNRDMRIFLLENNITRDKIADYKVGVETSNQVSLGKVQPALCLRAILTYWQD